MGPREEFLALFNRIATERTALSGKQIRLMAERLSKDHAEMMKLLNNEEAISRELSKN